MELSFGLLVFWDLVFSGFHGGIAFGFLRLRSEASFSSVGFLLYLLGFEIGYLGCVKLWSWSCGSCEAWGFGGSLKCWGWFIEDCGMKSLIKGWTFCGVWVRLIGCEWGWNWLCFVVKPVSVEDSEVGVWGGSYGLLCMNLKLTAFAKLCIKCFPFLGFEWSFVWWRYNSVVKRKEVKKRTVRWFGWFFMFNYRDSDLVWILFCGRSKYFWISSKMRLSSAGFSPQPQEGQLNVAWIIALFVCAFFFFVRMLNWILQCIVVRFRIWVLIGSIWLRILMTEVSRLSQLVVLSYHVSF